MLLDAGAPHLEHIAGRVGAPAIGEFGIDVARLHWDMTGMSVHGAFSVESQGEDFPVIGYGYPKDRRFDLKQVQAGLAVSADGGIPLRARVFGGGAAEVSQVAGAMKDLRAMAGKRDFLMVADSKLVPDREAGRPAELRETYRVLEDTHTLTGPRKSDPPLTVRRILVHSTANAAGRQAARDKRLAKATEDLNKLTAAAGGRHYKTREKTATRIGVIAAKRRVTSCLRWTVTDNEDGTPVLAWHFDTGVLKAEAAVEGWYALLTSMPADRADAGQALIHYKGQGTVERRYHDFKGPLAVTPVFVQHNRRVAALIQVICLALLVFCLVERQVRRALGPEQTMSGLYPDNRRVRPPAA
ncbi:hypothetical protein [Streptomyces sp. NPDC007205]|uniref:IS1634 family transposase n=1 Tax=Streptomyces sp. NPDC007205 TaxID=3154316 RepID=UPI0033DC5A57